MVDMYRIIRRVYDDGVLSAWRRLDWSEVEHAMSGATRLAEVLERVPCEPDVLVLSDNLVVVLGDEERWYYAETYRAHVIEVCDLTLGKIAPTARLDHDLRGTSVLYTHRSTRQHLRRLSIPDGDDQIGVLFVLEWLKADEALETLEGPRFEPEIVQCRELYEACYRLERGRAVNLAYRALERAVECEGSITRATALVISALLERTGLRIGHSEPSAVDDALQMKQDWDGDIVCDPLPVEAAPIGRGAILVKPTRIGMHGNAHWWVFRDAEGGWHAIEVRDGVEGAPYRVPFKYPAEGGSSEEA